jgi:L-ribulose-5-phosphate 4-epimerase
VFVCGRIIITPQAKTVQPTADGREVASNSAAISLKFSAAIVSDRFDGIEIICMRISTCGRRQPTSKAGFVKEFSARFRARPEITTVLHIHTPWLGGWAQTHKALPIRYAPRSALPCRAPILQHIDRSVSAANFILEPLGTDAHLVAIFEANGGVNAIGRKGLLDLAKFRVLVEDGAQFQAIAESLGGSVEFHPTNLAVQWGRTGLLDEAKQLGLV